MHAATLLDLSSAHRPCAAAECGAGYCDESVGLCTCPPGWAGDRCEHAFLPACRMSPLSPLAACAGFRGAMSCACHEQCARTLGAPSVAAHVCFARADGAALAPPNLSDVPRAAPLRFFVSSHARAAPLRAAGWRRRPLADASAAARALPGWRVPHELSPSAGAPLPLRRCPRACGHAGTCRAHRAAPRCVCHRGFSGAACAAAGREGCVNGCARHGVCRGRFCSCARGWFGVDCSLAATPRRHRLRFAPTFVYPLPTEWSLQYMYEGGRAAGGLFSAGRAFLQQLHARRDAIVADPEEAALFFVPVQLDLMGGNLWDPSSFLEKVVRWIAHRLPFWNRTQGADHVFFTTQDMGGCWVPPIMRRSIIVSHFGFIASTALWTQAQMWASARDEREPWRAALAAGNWSSPPCYDPRKDAVVPVYFRTPPEEAPSGDQPRSCQCDRGGCGWGERRTLLYMSGGITNAVPWYSQGVRDHFHRLHGQAAGVVYRVGAWDAVEMRNATFCLAPSGWGYGWRTYLALSMLCIPVIIQPLVRQAFHDLLPYRKFSVTFDPIDIARLPSLLKAIPARRICKLRRAAQHYRHAMTWEQPFGRAYDMLQLTLCRRALLIHARLGRASQSHLRSLSSCYNLSAEDFLPQS
ncbi:hypothetical protein AB1Y20_011764 [Prymnesium parvum]|uniref:EGF-like domain-containing protein n=1 Tax=Prymnesium parvum TaxID=97485 RepID=A0AB34II04_PRYPA